MRSSVFKPGYGGLGSDWLSEAFDPILRRSEEAATEEGPEDSQQERRDHPEDGKPTHPRPEVDTVSELMGIARFKFHEGSVEEFKRRSALSM